MSNLALRKTLEETVETQYEVFDQYQTAFELYEQFKEAWTTAEQMRRMHYSKSEQHIIPHERYAFMESMMKFVDTKQAAAMTKEMVEVEVWSHVFHSTNLTILMDKEAKDKFRDDLRTGKMPECTVDNVYSTVEEMLLQANHIFARGVANVFSKLDRRFKSHSGWKFGNRIILNNMFGSYGYSSRYRIDELYDIYRVFFALKNEKLPAPNCCGVIAGLNQHSYGRMTAVDDTKESGIPLTIEGDVYEDKYVKCRVFQNGNAHVYFKDKELMRQINKILAEYYGEVIPEERKYDDNEDAPEAGIKYEIAKNYAFFPTPEGLVDYIFEMHCGFPWNKRDTGATAFEPSAGTGRISSKLVAKGYKTTVNDIQTQFSSDLAGTGIYDKVLNQDFLMLTPESVGQFDLVCMNPPFDRERDIDHVNHAFQFVKSGGKLVAIMSAHTEYSETRKAKNFHKLIADNRGKIHDLPAGSFKESGTNVNTICVVLYKK